MEAAAISIDGISELTTRHPLDVAIRCHLELHSYRQLRDQWDKANDRLLGDPEGVITASRTLLEATCRHVLNRLQIACPSSADLPKLYSEACRALGMAPGGQLDPSFRAIFTSTHTIVQSVAEIRNKYGDSHSIAVDSPRPWQAEAELAVHLAGAVTCFLVRRYESYLKTARRLTNDGKALLRFEKSTVWRLVDHATNAPRSRLFYGEDVGRCIMLVGDAGIYLMSNGEPPIFSDGTLVPGEGEQRKIMLVADAQGCGPFAEFET